MWHAVRRKSEYLATALLSVTVARRAQSVHWLSGTYGIRIKLLQYVKSHVSEKSLVTSYREISWRFY